MRGNKIIKKILLILLSLSVLIIPTTAMADNNTTTTTTAPYWCTDGGKHHVITAGIGWYDSYNEARNAAMKIIGNGSGSWEVQECACGLFTAYVKVDESTTQHTHTWDNGIIIKEPTCTEKGSIKYTCSDCGATRTDIINELGHNYVYTITEPTCTEDGYTTYVCTRCKNSYVSDYVDAIGHNYKYTANNNGTHIKMCENCGLNITENCTKVIQGEYYICSYCFAQYGAVSTTNPSETTVPSTETTTQETTTEVTEDPSEDKTTTTTKVSDVTTTTTTLSEASTDEEPNKETSTAHSLDKTTTVNVTKHDISTVATTINDNTTNTTENNKSQTSPNTGDELNIELYVSLIVITTAIIFMGFVIKNKKAIQK